MEDTFFKILNICLVIIIALIGIAYKRICDDITEIKKKRRPVPFMHSFPTLPK